jgi:uncharacterized membrane protein YraQ (UPF0718 family)
MRRGDLNVWILGALVLVAGVVACRRDPRGPLLGIQSAGRLLSGVWPELLLGFLLAGLLDVIVPAQTVLSWLGPDRLGRGLLVATLVGLLTPGGPYLFFPVAARLLQQGAAPGPLIALLTAKTLVSPIRMLTYEAPLLGWPITLARLLPALLVPPILGLAGHWLHKFFRAA